MFIDPLRWLQYATWDWARADDLDGRQACGARKGKVSALGLDRRKSDGNANKLIFFSHVRHVHAVSLWWVFAWLPRSSQTANQTHFIHIQPGRLLHQIYPMLPIGRKGQGLGREGVPLWGHDEHTRPRARARGVVALPQETHKVAEEFYDGVVFLTLRWDESRW